MSFYESPSAPKTKTDFRWKQLQKVLQSQTARSFTTYRIFHTQSQAIEFQQSNENLKDLRIFSYEHNMSQLGSRKFIVANLRDFYDTYMKLPDRDCHHYELIQQAHNCHLYYDIEYDSRHNVGTSGNELVQILKTVTRKMLYQLFDCDPASIIFVELDSTSEIKFSRHLIVRMPGLVFKDNIQVGMFIKLVVASIKSSVIDTDLQKLVVFNKNGECLMFDESVYTKNRNFRLIKSSKLGKTVYLKEIIPGPLNFERFKQTLVCEDMHKLQIIELNGKVDALDVCRMQPIRFLTNPNQIESGSPWIEIDFYIISQIRNNTDPNSEIKSCLYLDTSNSKYCYNVNRQHKSNGIYYQADLEKGLYNQKCHDVDCRHFKSLDFRIPDHINPFAKNKLTNLIADAFGEITQEDIELLTHMENTSS